MTVEPLAFRVPELISALAGLRPRLVGDHDGVLSDVTDDSRKVRPGSVFVARRGTHHEGQKFVQDALDKGASLVITEHDADLEAPRIEVDSVPVALGLLAQKFWGDPSERLTVLAVTGTNGKTTTASLVEQALRGLGLSVARLGTLGFFIDGERIEDTLTTPGAVDLARLLATARARGARFCVMEVSSHALAQARIAGVRLAGAAFTNLSQDHLDYHGDMDSYGAAKAKLFFDYAPELSIVNIDDDFGKKLAERIRSAAPGRKLARFSRQGDPEAEIRAEDAQYRADGLRAHLNVLGRRFTLESQLVGPHNLENLLAALGLLTAAGFDVDLAAAELSKATAAPGRLERVSEANDDIAVIVDYAHSPAALEGALWALRATGPARITCVFGCGGDRDRGKRPLMGRAAAAFADEVIITTDNARSESPAAIAEEVASGIEGRPYRILLDRREAIFEAIGSAEPGTTVLIAGKGHETYQIIGDRTFPFDDAEQARQALVLRRRGSPGKGT